MKRAPFWLYTGDAVVIFLFAVIGRQSHDLPGGVSGLGAALGVAAPFIFAWLVMAPWFGAFHRPAWADARSAARITLKAFIPAFIVGVLLRALFLGRFSPPTFYLVAAGFLFPMLLVWRLVYTLVLAPRFHGPA
jgi:biotin transporter BioY